MATQQRIQKRSAMRKGEFTVKRIETVKSIGQDRPIQMHSVSAGLPEEEVRRRAYQIYEERGGTNGSELEDWLQAESEVRNKQQTLKAA